MKTFDEFVRESFFNIHMNTETSITDTYIEDYLCVLNHCTSEEQNEIKQIIENINSGLERISEIQDNCYGR